MNKWMVRFWGLLALLSLAMLLATSAWPAPPDDSDADLAQATLNSALQTTNEEYIGKAVAKSRVAVIEGAWRAPREKRVANILLKQGLTGAGVQALLAPDRLELVGMEAKVPVPGRKHVVTLGIGRERLVVSGESIQRQVDGALEQERAKFRAVAQRFAAGSAEQQTRELNAIAGSEEFKVYRLEAIGTRESFSRLAEHRWVRAVFVDEDEKRIDALRREPGIVYPPGVVALEATEQSVSAGTLLTDWPVAPNAALALQTQRNFLQATDEAAVAQKLESIHEVLRRDAEQESDARRAADVLLTRGFNASEIERLLVRHGLEYVSCEASVPDADGETVTFLSVAGGFQLPLAGPIAERVEHDIGRWRGAIMLKAGSSQDPEVAAKDRQLAMSHEIGVYRVEVVGTLSSLVALLQEPEVRGVIAEADGARARRFEDLKARTLQMPVYRRRVPFDQAGTLGLPPIRLPE